MVCYDRNRAMVCYARHGAIVCYDRVKVKFSTFRQSNHFVHGVFPTGQLLENSIVVYLLKCTGYTVDLVHSVARSQCIALNSC